ncbi:glycoside hydrolase family 10 protein [Leptolyngbya sp. AN02str]|uniref:glycoside hydrolase family 10 protein n=1 Tax=Leptolyngbya sp. AN02str TaxID=3423363 RepID=UPI003D3113ED
MVFSRLRWFSGLLAIGMAIALLLHLPIAATANPPMTELRGIWLTNIDSEVLFSSRNVVSGLRRLRYLNFNTLYPTVWNGGYTQYPSPTALATFGIEQDPYPGFAGRDMLGEMVVEGHRQGMAVIPWFEFGLMAPAQSELVEQHPDWVTQKRDGDQIWMEGGVIPRVWLSPSHPEVQDFMVNLLTEAVRRYRVDGIQLDDHFGIPVAFGYDPITINKYKAEHNGAEPPEDARDPDWVRWRANEITQLMRRVVTEVKAINPDCVISMSPNPRKFSYDEYLQDWGSWERRGLIDELIVQVYRYNMERFEFEIDRADVQTAKEFLPVSIGILAGLRNNITDMSLINEQVEAVRDRGYAGVAFFFYETLGNRDSLFRGLFPTPARRPEPRNLGFD